MANNVSKFTLGTVGNLKLLFPFTPSTMALADCIGLCLNKTLERDGFAGAWADVYAKKNPAPTDSVYVSIASPDPTADVTGYQALFAKWLAAVQAGLTIYNNNDNPKPTDIAFLSPFGLAMLNTKSVQLLHYPPTETLGSMDYLYSPTNRRWETLLGCNGCPSPANKLLETIVDLIPVAANGGNTGGTEVNNFKQVFADYDMQMLNVLVRNTGGVTQPVVAYGGPVMQFINTQFPNATDLAPSQITGHPSKTPSPLSLYKLQILTSGPTTAVLCANHPSKFMYYPSQEKGQPPTDWNLVMMQDLVAARWQAQMAASPASDPVATLTSAWQYWNASAQASTFKAIFAAQVAEFTSGSSNTSPKPQPGKPSLTLPRPASEIVKPNSPAKPKPAAKPIAAPAKKAAPAKSRR